MPLNRSARVGLTVLAGLLCAGLLAAFLGRLRLAHDGYPVTVLFDDVDSLKVDAPVLYGGGVDLGRVAALDLRGGKVAVVLALRKGVQVPAGAEIGISTAGILGEKYVEVSPGDGAVSGFLAPGAVVQGVDPGSLDRALRKVEALADAVEPLLSDPKTKAGLGRVLDNLDKAARDLDAMVAENRSDLRASVGNLRRLTDSLDETAREVRPLAGRADRLLSEDNLRKMQDGVDRMDDSLAKLDAMLDRIQAKRGTLGLLLYDDETADDLRTLLRDLKAHPWKLLWKK